MISGREVGKIGTVKKVLRKSNRLLVEGVNLVRRYNESLWTLILLCNRLRSTLLVVKNLRVEFSPLSLLFIIVMCYWLTHRKGKVLTILLFFASNISLH